MRYLLPILFLCIVSFSYGNILLERTKLETKGVKYLAYSKKNQNHPVDIRDISFDDDRKTAFIIHGYWSKSFESQLRLKDELFQYAPNMGRVIVVSWLDYSTFVGKF